MHQDTAHRRRCRPRLSVLIGLAALACSPTPSGGGPADRQVVRDGPWLVVCTKDNEVVFEHDDIYRVLRVDGTSPGIADYETGDGITFRGRIGESVNCTWERLAPPPAETVSTAAAGQQGLEAPDAPDAPVADVAVASDLGDAGNPGVSAEQPREEATDPPPTAAATAAENSSASIGAAAGAEGDLAAAGPPAESAPALNQSTPAAPPEADPAVTGFAWMTMEAIDHGDFVRLVLRADDALNMSIDNTGDAVEILTDRPRQVEMVGSLGSLSGYVTSVRALPGDKGLALVLRRPLQVDHAAIDGGVIVDLRPYVKVEPDAVGAQALRSPAGDLRLDLSAPPAAIE